VNPGVTRYVQFELASVPTDATARKAAYRLYVDAMKRRKTRIQPPEQRAADKQAKGRESFPWSASVANEDFHEIPAEGIEFPHFTLGTVSVVGN
jgi:hypothetical protein